MSVVLEGEITKDVSTTSPPEPDVAFIRKAIDGCNINALRLALYQLTLDESLLKLKVVPKMLRGGALMQSVVADEDVQIVKDKALAWLLNEKPKQPKTPPPPSKTRARELMAIYSGAEIPDVEFEFNYEELAFEDFPRQATWRAEKPPQSDRDAHTVLIIGAGISGICMGINLKRLGIPFTIIERYSAFGGTWYINQYPDCRVDTPSHLFQFKFEKNYPWTEYFASAPETLRYLNYCVDKYDLKSHVVFDVEAKKATWVESQSKWVVEAIHKDGKLETYEANSIVSCSGSLSTAKVPDMPGVHDFEGPIFHTQSWDHSAKIKGARVAVVGNGSTGTQLMPVIAKDAAHVTVFQRTPQWIAKMDGYRTLITEDVRWIFDNVPYYWSWHCYSVHVASQQLHGLQYIDHEWRKKGGYINERNDKIRAGLTAYIQSKVGHIPGMVEKVLPNYAPLVRRLVVDNGWYDALCRDNVELVASGIDHISKKGIVTPDGVEREFDTIVLAVGFDVNAFFSPMKYYGLENREIHDNWKVDGPRSYLGVSHLHMPNFFSTLGPNRVYSNAPTMTTFIWTFLHADAPRAGGLYSWAEIWCRYIGNCIAGMVERRASSMVIKEDAYAKYQILLDAQLKDAIWGEPGHGYYVNRFLRPNINNPFTMWEAQRLCLHVKWEDYHVK